MFRTYRARRDLHVAAIAIGVWGVFFAIVTANNLMGGGRSLDPCYRSAVRAWWDRQDIYCGPGGMNYLPTFALLYAPFGSMPQPFADVCWRTISTLLLIGGVARLASATAPAGMRIAGTGVALLAAFPSAISTVQSGQANLILAASFAHAAACLIGRRWGESSLWLGLGLSVKPLAIVLILLAVAGYPPLRWRLPAVCLGFLSAPFLFGPWEYVATQYSSFARNIQQCSALMEDRFCDLKSALACLGMEIGDGQWLMLRATCALLFLVTLLIARPSSDSMKAQLLLGLGALYVLLFNPMTETNSYVLIGPSAAVAFAHAVGRSRHHLATAVLLGFVLALGCDNYGRSIQSVTGTWLKASATALFAMGLVAVAVRSALAARSVHHEQQGVHPMMATVSERTLS